MNSEQIKHIIKDWHSWPNICSEKPTNNNFSSLVKGLTNNNLLFRSDTSNKSESEAFVFRINAQNAQSLGLNRHAEWHIHQSIAQYNICKPYIYRDPQDIYWIRPFIKNKTLHEELINCEETALHTIIKGLAKKLKLTHSIPLSSAWPKIDFKQRTDHYWAQILRRNDSGKHLMQSLQQYKTELDTQLKSPGYALKLCHMDPNPNNWIIDNKEVFLIDWEYSAIGNPAWDLAVLFESSNFNEDHKILFLKHYGSKNITEAHLSLAHRQMKYLSALWYCVQGIISPDNLIAALDDLAPQVSALLYKQKSQFD